MSAIVWDNLTDRTYQAGLDRGVLYVNGSDSGVPWNGLTAVEENAAITTEPFYFEGFKTIDLPVIDDFSGTIKAFTYPDEFMSCEGIYNSGYGLFLTAQNPKSFGMSYRTLVGNPTAGLDFGYKIHVLYNLTAVVDTTSRATLGADTDPLELSWTVTSRPADTSNVHPTAHLIIDSKYTDPTALAAVEAILYGTDEVEPSLPIPDVLILAMAP